MSDLQYSLRRSKNTDHALDLSNANDNMNSNLILISYLYNCLISLDIQSLFNNVHMDNLKSLLNEYNIPDMIKCFYFYFLSGRKVIIDEEDDLECNVSNPQR